MRKKKTESVIVELPYKVQVFADGRLIYNCSYNSKEAFKRNLKYLDGHLGSGWTKHETSDDKGLYGIIQDDFEMWFVY